MNEIETRVDTKARILDSAERLFGAKGFDATSLREITSDAGTNLAAVNYHFQTKDSLIEALIERRLGPVAEKRRDMLEVAGPDPSLEQVIEAFLAPLLMPELRLAVPMLGRVLSDPSFFHDRVYRPHLTATVERFTAALLRAVPGLSREECFWRLHFMAGSLTHVLALSSVLPKMQHLPGVTKPPSDDAFDRHQMVDRMIPFLAGGFRAAAVSPKSSERPPKQLRQPSLQERD